MHFGYEERKTPLILQVLQDQICDISQSESRGLAVDGLRLSVSNYQYMWTWNHLGFQTEVVPPLAFVALAHFIFYLYKWVYHVLLP